METIEITKEKVNKFVVAGKFYINANIAKKSVLWVNVDTLLETYIDKLKKIDRERDYVRMKFCKKTNTQHIEFTKNGSYQFKEDDNKKVLDEFDRIDKELVEMPILIVPKGQYPEKGLSYDIRDAFKGIVIPTDEYPEKKELAKLLELENARIEEEEEVDQENQ